MKCIRVCGETNDDGSFYVDSVRHEIEPDESDAMDETDDWNTITQIMRIREEQSEQDSFTYVFPFQLEDESEE